MQAIRTASRLLSAAILAALIANHGAAAEPAGPPRLIAPPKLIEAAMPQITIPPELATKVGHQVWLNETGGNRDMITAWNEAEDFASLGIGHFIWFPEGLKTRFKESFPAMMAYLRERGAKPPAWLDHDRVPPCPWPTRTVFKREFNSHKTKGLRVYLHSTVGLQAEYLALRMQAALPKILTALESDQEREHARRQFYRVVAASPDLYPLIDYINFKGEGIAASETYPNKQTGVPEGWGLKHVLLHMQGDTADRAAVLGSFADAARFVLLRRIANNPPNKRWQAGWMARVETYRRPLK